MDGEDQAMGAALAEVLLDKADKEEAKQEEARRRALAAGGTSAGLGAGRAAAMTGCDDAALRAHRALAEVAQMGLWNLSQAQARPAQAPTPTVGAEAGPAAGAAEPVAAPRGLGRSAGGGSGAGARGVGSGLEGAPPLGGWMAK